MSDGAMQPSKVHYAETEYLIQENHKITSWDSTKDAHIGCHIG